MATQLLVKKADYAKKLGISKAAVTQACRPGGKLFYAQFGASIDMAHPDAVTYAALQKGRKDRAAAKKLELEPKVDGRKNPTHRAGGGVKKDRLKRAEQNVPANPIDLIPTDIRKLADKPLRELIDMFGTDTRFVDFLKATAALEKIHADRIKNATDEGVLVNRVLVKDAVIAVIEAEHVRLMTDGADTIEARLADMVKAGRTREERRAYVRDQVGSYIKSIKLRVTRGLSKKEKK